MYILFFYLIRILVGYYSTLVNKTQLKNKFYSTHTGFVLLPEKKYFFKKLTRNLSGNIINNSFCIYKKEKSQKEISGEQSCR